MLPNHSISICHQNTLQDWLTLLKKTINTGFDLKAKDLPTITFIGFSDSTNFSENALKTIYGLSDGSEIGIINFILQVTLQNAQS